MVEEGEKTMSEELKGGAFEEVGRGKRLGKMKLLHAEAAFVSMVAATHQPRHEPSRTISHDERR